MEEMMQNKVTVVTPAWNSEKYIEHTVKSVQKQTYTNWEMIIVDDCSTDNTVKIIKEISKLDTRIRLLCQKKNLGAGAARTRAIHKSTGRFIAFLDADDIWKEKKLEKQINFMQEKNCGFSCTSYEVINDNGIPLNKKIHMPPKLDYLGFLTNNLLQTLGILIDTKKVDKNLLVMPNIRRRQDAATWLKILKSGYVCYGLDDILAEYRRTVGSLSSNKFKAARGVWKLYRDIEHLPFLFSCYCFIRYAFLATWKRSYFSHIKLRR